MNFLLHAAAAVLVWRLLVRLAIPGAWLAAAIFAVHPVEVESVAWASERKNVLSALALGSILAYLRIAPPRATQTVGRLVAGSQRSMGLLGLALALYVAALWSKTVTASVPAVLLVIYWWKHRAVTRRDVTRLAPFFVVGLAFSWLTAWMEKVYVKAEGQEWDLLSSVDRCLIAGRALWFYAAKLVWPNPLIFFYPRWEIDSHAWWQYLFPAAALAVIVGLWYERSVGGAAGRRVDLCRSAHPRAGLLRRVSLSLFVRGRPLSIPRQHRADCSGCRRRNASGEIVFRTVRAGTPAGRRRASVAVWRSLPVMRPTIIGPRSRFTKALSRGTRGRR